jgi:gliding motility-associated-like protein
MRKIFLILLILIIYSTTTNAQGEANIWYFGNNAGLDFNTNPPTPLTNGALSTYEGCASIADKSGALVFYTDGSTVWNKNHVAMPNGTGLFGNSSANQSAIIVPYPGTYNYYKQRFDKYYIVTVDVLTGSTYGVCYTEVDMTLNAGIGGVTAVKNINLFGAGIDGTTEKICVAKHSNDCDFWIITKPINTPDYNVYAVTSAGFNTTPIISSVGPTTGIDYGSMKASSNSKMIAATHAYGNQLHVYDFNNTTGVLTNKFSNTAAVGQSYGVEFSSDNKVLYNTGLSDRNIYQYDLTVGNNAAFLASKLSIGSTATPSGGYTACALQLASNGKIYVALFGDNVMSVINSPNTLGVGAGFSDRTVALGGKISQLGLPAIVASLIRPVNKITMLDSCQKQAVYFGLLDTSKILTYDWRFATLANPNSAITASVLFNPVKTFNLAGDYLITAINHYACYTDTLIDTLHIVPQPTLSLTPTMVDCFGAANGAVTVVATGATAPYMYAWSNAANTATITTLTPAKYVVTVTDAKGCIKKDSTTITEPASALSISNTVITNVKCFGGTDGDATPVATGGTPPYTYGWLTAPPQLTATATGLIAGTYNYGVKDNNNCQVLGTATVTEPTQLTVAISGNKVNCANDVTTALTTLTAIAANGTGPNYTYSWTPTNVTTNTTVCTSTVGTTVYTVTTTDQNNCTAIANVSHVVNPNPVVTYSVAPVCFNQASAFTSIVTVVPVADITLYAWQFNGSGVPATATSSLVNPTYMFANCNQAYSATLVVQSNVGCIGVSNAAVPATVYCLPMPNFSANDDCAKDATITFNNTSANGAGTIGALTNAWLLDSTGAITTSASPTHVYNYAGTYTIPLIVKDINNCVDTIVKTLKIYPKPEANFMLTKDCFGKPTLMSNSTTIVNPVGFTDVVNGYKWDYDYVNNNFTTDVTTSGASTVYPITATEQSPNATLIVTTNHNCSDTLSKLVTVWPMPVADYSITEPCFPTATKFTNNSSVAGGTDNSAIATMALDWGDTQIDAITLSNEIKNYNYAVSNAYSTELTVTSNHNCVSKKQVPIIIHPKPTALFSLTPSEGCSPVCASFTNQSTQLNLPANEPISNYAWNMGDYNFIKISDNTASTQHATHCYENTSDTTQHYTITLIVSTAYGCADTLVKTDSVAVYALPKASFNVTPKVVDLLNPEMIITDQSHLADELKWVYKLGGDTTTVSNATPLSSTFPYRYTYKDSGTYTILQVAITNNGCIDTAMQTVHLKPVYTLYVPNTFTPNDDRINDYFMIKSTGIKTLTLTIYDRWGTVVGKVDDPASKGWDGNDVKTSAACKTDVYTWKLNYTDIFNAEHSSLTGQVTLLK